MVKNLNVDIKDILIKNSSGNLYWKDENGVYKGCNNNFAKILNLVNPENIKGKTEYDFFEDKKLAEKIITNDKKVLSSGNPLTLEEIGLDAEGQKAIYISHKIPIKDEQGKVVGLIGTSIDITKQKEAEYAKNEFISNISHDLRTPFSGIFYTGKPQAIQKVFDTISNGVNLKQQEKLIDNPQRLILAKL